MGHYLINFTVYLLAMTGVVFLAFIVWKNVTTIKNGMSKSSMKIEDSLNLAPRKNLYIIRIENERFLIASDADKTTFLSKLEDNEGNAFVEIQDAVNKQDVEDEITSKIKLKEVSELEDLKDENIGITKEKSKKPVNILQELVHQRGKN